MNINLSGEQIEFIITHLGPEDTCGDYCGGNIFENS